MQASIMGHSMGGHGALIIGLRNPDKYAAISAFAPIANPSEVRSIQSMTNYSAHLGRLNFVAPLCWAYGSVAPETAVKHLKCKRE